MVEFDPDAFLAGTEQPIEFDPDAFLAGEPQPTKLEDPASQLPEGTIGAAPIETAMTIGSSIIAEPVAGVAGLVTGFGATAGQFFGGDLAGAKPADLAKQAVEATRQALTFQPRTRQGQEALQDIGESAPVKFLVDNLQGAEEFLGDVTFEITGSAEAAALATTAPSAALEAIGLATPVAIAKGLAKLKLLKEAKADRIAVETGANLEISPKAQQAVDEVGITKKEASELTDGQLDGILREAGKKPLIEGIEQASGLIGKEKGLKKVAEAVEVDPEIAQAAKDLGIDIADVPENVLSSNENFRSLFGAVQSLPGSSLGANKKRLLQKLAEKAENIVDEVGGEVGNVSSSIKLQKDMKQMIDDMSDIEEIAYKKDLLDKIGASTEINPKVVMRTLNKRMAETGFEGLTPLEKKIFSRLAPKVTTQTISKSRKGAFDFASGGRKVIPAVTETITKNPTWTRIDDLRKELNKARFNKGEFKDMAAGELDLYTGLVRADQKALAESLGLGDNFEAAMNMTKIKKQTQESMQVLFGKALDKSLRKTLTPAVTNLAKGDIKEFTRFAKALPARDRSNMLTGVIGDFMINSKGADSLLDAAKFSKWFNDLSAKPEAKNALFSQLEPQAVQKIEAMGKLSSAIKRAGEDAITTGRINSIGEAFKVSNDIVETLLDGGVKAAATTAAVQGSPGFGALVGRMLKSAPKDDLAAKTAKVLGSPKFQKLVADMSSNADPKIIAKQDEAVKSSKAWKDYISKLPIPEADKIQLLNTSVVSFLSGEEERGIKNSKNGVE